MRIQTLEQVQRLIDVLQLGVEAIAGSDWDGPIDPVEARFTLVLRYVEVPENEFPLTFTFKFGGKEPVLVKCILRKVLPADCQILDDAVEQELA